MEKKPEDNLEELKKKLEQAERAKDQYLDGWQRSRADFINYIKDEGRRIEEFLKYANESMAIKILPLLDSFESASSSLPQDLIGNQYIKGFLRIKEQLRELLEAEGIEEISASPGDKFDPNIHEAVGTIEESIYNQDCVAEIKQKGYKLKDKLIRPAKVIIAKNKSD